MPQSPKTLHNHVIFSSQSTEPSAQVVWENYMAPDNTVLERLADELDLPKKVLLNCMDPDYLPQMESYGDVHFVVLRFLEPNSKLNADTVQELTTKIAIFMTKNKVISIYRIALVEIDEVVRRMRLLPPEEVTAQRVVSYFFDQVSIGFDAPLNDLEHKMENFEEKIFHSKKTKSLLQEGYYIKRKSSVMKKVIKFSSDTLAKFITKTNCPTEHVQVARDRFERNQFYADDVYENIQALLSLHMSIESQKTNEASFKTNEIMRVLTVISIFFLPLNFLAGVFGMNFEHIPLLRHEWGFWISVGSMIFISALITMYVIRHGWLSKPDLEMNKEK